MNLQHHRQDKYEIHKEISRDTYIYIVAYIYTPRYKRMRPRASLCPIAVLLVLLLRQIQSILQKSNYPIHFLAESAELYQECARTHKKHIHTHAKIRRIIRLSMVLWISARVACVLITVSSLCPCDAHYARLTSKSTIRLLAKHQTQL